MLGEPKYDGDVVNLGYLRSVLGKLDTELSNTNTLLLSKTQNFGTLPQPPYHRYDTYMGPDGIYICHTERLIGEYNALDWGKASTYENVGDAFDRGIITAGTLQAVNGGNYAAGMTGQGTGDGSVRIWAGSTYANRANAPFRVTQGGVVDASNVNITGGKLHLQASDTGYTTLKVTDVSDSTYYSGLTGKSFTLWHGNKRRVYLTQILDSSALVLQSEDNTQAVFSSNGSSNTSDIRLKYNTKNIDIKTSYDIINTLTPIEFTYKNGNTTHRGLSAQQVKKVLNKKGIKNQIYSKDLDNKYYMLNYTEFIPDLINCIKYQNKKINTLEKRLEKTEKRLEKIEKGDK